MVVSKWTGSRLNRYQAQLSMLLIRGWRLAPTLCMHLLGAPSATALTLVHIYDGTPVAHFMGLCHDILIWARHKCKRDTHTHPPSLFLLLLSAQAPVLVVVWVVVLVMRWAHLIVKRLCLHPQMKTQPLGKIVFSWSWLSFSWCSWDRTIYNEIIHVLYRVCVKVTFLSYCCGRCIGSASVAAAVVGAVGGGGGGGGRVLCSAVWLCSNACCCSSSSLCGKGGEKIRRSDEYREELTGERIKGRKNTWTNREWYWPHVVDCLISSANEHPLSW